MTKFTFKSEFTDDAETYNSTTTKEFTADTLTEVVEEFKEFLLGAGFSHDNVKQVFEGIA